MKITVLIGILSLIQLTGVVSLYAEEKTIFFGGNYQSPPVEYIQKGKTVGMFHDLLQELSKTMARRMEHNLYSWDEAQKKLNSEEIDALTIVIPHEQIRQSYDFSDPIFLLEFTLFVPQNNLIIHSVEDIEGMIVGVKIGSYSHHFLEGKKGVQLRFVKNYKEAFQLLLEEKLDVIAGEKWIASYVLQQENLRQIRPVSPSFARKFASIAVKKGKTKLLQDLNEGIRNLNQMGKIDEIMQRWSPESIVSIPQKKLNQIYQWGVGISIGFILVFGALMSTFFKRQRRQYQAALARIEEKFVEETEAHQRTQLLQNNIEESSLSGAITLTPQGLIQSFNLVAQKIFGYHEVEVLGKEFSMLMPSFYQEKSSQTIEIEELQRLEGRKKVVGMKSNGLTFPMEIFIKKVIISHKRMFIGIIHDISERQQLEKDLVKAEREANLAQKAKTQVMSDLSHEIRPPLSAIIGFTQILLRRAKFLNLPESCLKPLNNINIASKNLSAIINNTLDLRRIETGKFELIEESIDLKQLVKNIYSISKVKAQEKKVWLTYGFGHGIPDMIISDPTILSQVLLNLIGNAIRYTPEKKGIQIKVFQENEWLFFQVNHRGIKVPQEEFDSNFGDFQQLQDQASEESGRGLGMTQKIVSLLGGTMEIRNSPEDKGSNFFLVKLPLKDPSLIMQEETEREEMKGESSQNKEIQKSEAATGSYEIKSYQFLKDKYILFVEGNAFTQEVMDHLFEELGISYELARNGEEGIRKALKFKKEGRLPDAILMDIHSYGMDSIETTRQLRLLPEFSKIPIIVLGEVGQEQEKKALSTGINEYIKKPVDLNVFVSTLSKYLN